MHPQGPHTAAAPLHSAAACGEGRTTCCAMRRLRRQPPGARQPRRRHRRPSAARVPRCRAWMPLARRSWRACCATCLPSCPSPLPRPTRSAAWRRTRGQACSRWVAGGVQGRTGAIWTAGQTCLHQLPTSLSRHRRLLTLVQCWGPENREAPLRLCATPSVPDACNAELKAFDATANPHLGAAALIGARGWVVRVLGRRRGPLPPHPADCLRCPSTHRAALQWRAFRACAWSCACRRPAAWTRAYCRRRSGMRRALRACRPRWRRRLRPLTPTRVRLAGGAAGGRG